MGANAPAQLAAIAQAVRKSVQEGIGLTLDDVVALGPGLLPKTSSGKLQRAHARELYETGQLSSSDRARSDTRLDTAREAALSQLSYFKLAVLGGRKPRS